MALLFETPRLQAVSADSSLAKDGLRFEVENREAFAPFGVERESAYYTLSSFRSIYRLYDELFRSKRGLTALYYEKNELIAVVSLSQILYAHSQSAKLGYSVDHRHWHMGYGKEAVTGMITYAFERLGLHRLEANILPTNNASIKLIEALGFTSEGIVRHYAQRNGVWEDHLRYSLINESS
ncbi:MAG: GNAT family protein [Sphaerochaeta sp.]